MLWWWRQLWQRPLLIMELRFILGFTPWGFQSTSTASEALSVLSQLCPCTSFHILSFKVIQNQTEGKCTRRRPGYTGETTANVHYMTDATATSKTIKKTIFHLTEPAEPAQQGDADQSITLVAMAPASTLPTQEGKPPHDTKADMDCVDFLIYLLICPAPLPHRRF